VAPVKVELLFDFGSPNASLAEHVISDMHKCISVSHSPKAGRVGCEAVRNDAVECGGHPGVDDLANMILPRRAADALKIPFVTASGTADACSLVAALARHSAYLPSAVRQTSASMRRSPQQHDDACSVRALG
jgi:NAD(P)H-dependent flavin oxidoreductase YrpB (nitropropane dioxygenase family)